VNAHANSHSDERRSHTVTVITDRQRQVEDELVRMVLASFDGAPIPGSSS